MTKLTPLQCFNVDGWVTGIWPV